jgi:hypothetical protein
MKAKEAAALAQSFKNRISEEMKKEMEAKIEEEYNRILSWVAGCAEHGYGAMCWHHDIKNENRQRLINDGYDIAYKGGIVLVWDATLPLCENVGCWLPNAQRKV